MPPSLSGCSSGGLFGVTTPSIIGGFGTTAGQCVLPLTVLGGFLTISKCQNILFLRHSILLQFWHYWRYKQYRHTCWQC